MFKKIIHIFDKLFTIDPTITITDVIEIVQNINQGVTIWQNKD